MTGPDDGEVVICYGSARLCDTHLASRIVAVDDEIFKIILERRERRKGIAVRAARGNVRQPYCLTWRGVGISRSGAVRRR
jgi:hypothetical protein